MAQVYGAGVWASLALMCASAICGSITDLAFDLEGYLWQLVCPLSHDRTVCPGAQHAARGACRARASGEGTPLYGCAQVNCLFTASYSLYLRGVMDTVVQVTLAGIPLLPQSST